MSAAPGGSRRGASGTGSSIRLDRRQVTDVTAGSRQWFLHGAVPRILVDVGGLVDVELLVIPGCPHAAPAEQMLRSVLRAAGLPATEVRVSTIDNQQAAEQRAFVGSPTILVNGVDPFAEPGRPPALACRLYPGPAGPSGLPPAGQLRAALTHVVSRSPTETP